MIREGDPLLITSTVSEAERISGIDFPTAFRSEWKIQHMGKWLPYMTGEYTVDDVAVNTVSDGVFCLPPLKEGDDVRDSDTRKMYKVGKNRRLPLIK